jgi:hypothetical protein
MDAGALEALRQEAASAGWRLLNVASIARRAQLRA